MARENQGLHAALIVLFILTIGLGVGTYFSSSQYLEKKELATRLQSDLTAAQQTSREIQDFANRMKKWTLGVDGAEAMEVLRAEEEVQADLDKYSAGYDDVAKSYRDLLAHFDQLVDGKSAELADAREAANKMQSDYEAWKAQTDKQIADLEAARRSADERLREATQTFQTALAQIEEGKDVIQANWEKSREEGSERLANLETERDQAVADAQKLQTLVTEQGDKLDIITQETIEVPDGMISRVDQRTGTVWINLGEADGLRRQATFSVFPMDLTNLAKATVKASIEVTQIRGEHSAEARIIEDDLTDPIIPGDKVYTPVWNPGEKVRFAILGLMDIDGDGKSDLDMVREVIETGGGLVDCVIDENGNREGEMSIATQYIVIDSMALDVRDTPGEAQGANVRAAVYSEAIEEANRLAIKKITLGDLLRKMGWKNRTPVVRYGREADSRDFQPRPPEGVSRTSSGTVSDLFQPRRAPANGLTPRGGAY